MQTFETVEMSVDIADPIGFFMNKNMLHMRLESELVDKCKNGYFVLGVEEIVKTSTCRVDFLDPHCVGRMSVVVRLRALRYAVGDIVASCLVQVKTKANTIVCRKGPLVITVKAGPHNNAITLGHTAIVRITATYFTPGLQIISAEGELYTFSPSLTLYRINFEEVDAAVLAPIIAAARDEFEATKDLPWRRAFAQAWTTPQQLPSDAKTVSLFELTSGLVGADNRVDLTSGSVVTFVNTPTNATIQDCESSTMALCNLYWGLRNLLLAIRDLAEEFEKNPKEPACKTSLVILARSRM
jgi:hypothetical protein